MSSKAGSTDPKADRAATIGKGLPEGLGEHDAGHRMGQMATEVLSEERVGPDR